MDIDDDAFKGIEAIIRSMTPEERTNPQLLNGSRRKRIADGSGTSVQEVNQLIKQFGQMGKMMKMMQGGGAKQMMQMMKGRGGIARNEIMKMNMTILDGKKTSNDIKEEIAVEVSQLISSGGKKPHLAAILVGNNGASETYVNAKVKACEKVGFDSTLIRLNDTISEEELLVEVEKINQNECIDGLIVQLPLPNHIDEIKITEAILPQKDVDGFHPANVGRMALDLPTYLPATPAGIVELLKRYKVETSGKHCVVIGRSHIVGSPMSILMARNSYPGNATVTLTHSRHTKPERNLSESRYSYCSFG